MQVAYKVSDRLSLTFEAAGQKEVFTNLSQLSEIFGINKCGACGKDQIRHVVRHATKGNKKFDFYELHCQNPQCRARLSFGQHAENGTLFPKRKDGDTYLPNNGWIKFNKEAEDNEPEKPAF